MAKRDTMKKSLIGKSFNRLTILETFYKKIGGCTTTTAICYCKCSETKQNLTVHRARDVELGRVKSCGCYHKEISTKRIVDFKKTHGKSNTRLYKIWQHMKDRCNNPNENNYENYGGRGIIIYSLWAESFEAFYEWSISSGYQDNLTIERKNVNGNYEPQNCEWITLSKQANNKTNSRFAQAFGEIKNVTEWERDERCIVSRKTLQRRINKGWNAEKAMTTPAQKNRRIIFPK